jgi:tellurite resistance protein TehA-like permease
VYGVPLWGFAMLWLAIAITLTARTARDGLPFGLTWWSFTFPVGTVVTGTSGLAQLTGNNVLQAAAGVLFVLLISAWAVVAVRTVRGVPTATSSRRSDGVVLGMALSRERGGSSTSCRR